MLYLKDLVSQTPDGILTLRIDSIGPIEQTRTGKDVRKVHFSFPSTGKPHAENVFNWQFNSSLLGAKVGSMVEVRVNGAFPAFRLLRADSETSDQPSQSNYAQVKNERGATATLEAKDKERELKDIQICLQGFMQQAIAGMIYHERYSSVLTPDYKERLMKDALEIAVLAREALLKKSRELQLGFTPPVSSVSIEEVDNVFGQDISPTL